MTHVIDASAAVRTVVCRNESGAHELCKELPRLLAKDDASEGRVLAHDADAGVPRDEDQEAGLTLGESARCDRLNGVLEVHRSSSSMIRGSGVRPPLFPVLAVMVSP